MGIEESINKAAENAMEDLAGTSEPVKGGQVPEPNQKADDIQVHSSLSEGSNAMDSDTPEEQAQATSGRAGSSDSRVPATGDGGVEQDTGITDSDINQDREGDQDIPTASGDVPGPAGLPNGDPDALRADPSEGGEDPSTNMGLG
ncbi:hypothetical protein [Paenarthrobacter ureafaciens]|uniref:hypothetical protein n=1 Tax=Paenarthrobacter ureafaciens TaxID=37931 RepID=UPI001FB50B0B|nr:hypothetical protein [Paenarthrobacter ureafaciens]UOD82299.1 hypothetical protein MQZ73_05375 [Paenarthrobacter ureafaciens]WNZ05797.1 hypothetical protein PVT25_09925 [Paenarthrobacter ureafaciens]